MVSGTTDQNYEMSHVKYHPEDSHMIDYSYGGSKPLSILFFVEISLYYLFRILKLISNPKSKNLNFMFPETERF